MIRKMISVLLIGVFTASAAAQDGWAHTVQPVFNEPFSDVLLPWPADVVEQVDVRVCWVNEEPPFLGSEWRFWCYAMPSSVSSAPLVALDAGFKDAGYSGTLVGEWMPQENGSLGFGSYAAPEDGGPRRVYVFERGGTLLVGLAAR